MNAGVDGRQAPEDDHLKALEDARQEARVRGPEVRDAVHQTALLVAGDPLVVLKTVQSAQRDGRPVPSKPQPAQRDVHSVPQKDPIALSGDQLAVALVESLLVLVSETWYVTHPLYVLQISGLQLKVNFRRKVPKQLPCHNVQPKNGDCPLKFLQQMAFSGKPKGSGFTTPSPRLYDSFPWNSTLLT